jgi:Ca-activated chloride channel homolog
MISKDFTTGYGPEEYLVRRALAGDYRIKANFYGSNAPTLTGPTTVQATVITHFGRPTEKRRALTLRLTEKPEKEADVEADEEEDDESGADTVEVGVIRFAQ